MYNILWIFLFKYFYEVIRMTLEDFICHPTGARVALLGIGRANRAVLAWLQAAGCSPIVMTEQMPDEGTRLCLQKLGVPLTVSPFRQGIDADVLVRSPGLRPDLPVLAEHQRAGGLVTEESAVTLSLLPCPVIGVTGSDGKTTTAALCEALLRAAGARVWLGGNNGVPLLGRIGEIKKADIAVMELSSFQLMGAPRAADVAILTNITPNHLNWHTDMAEYIAAKCNILDLHTRLVTNAACEITRRIGLAHAARGGKVVLFGGNSADSQNTGEIFADGADVVLRESGADTRYTCLRDFQLAGRHNRENLLAALAATAPWLTPAAPALALRGFYGVPHRLQYVATVRGVRYYNSSIDTSPTRTAAALSALDGSPIVIAGGRGKGISLAPLCAALREHARAVCLYGETAVEIAAGLGTHPHSVHVRFAEAFAAAAALAREGDTVLLSPGCTAFGEFTDFEERGACFCRLVEALAAERK